MPIPKPVIRDGKLYTQIGTYIETGEDYELLEVLAPGANGVVIRGRNRYSRRVEALKVYLHQADYILPSRSPVGRGAVDMRDKFAQATAEATAIAAVSDPH